MPTSKKVGVIVAGHLQPIAGLKQGLQELGWIEADNISFELRAAEGALDRLPELASEIVQLDVEVIAVIGETGTPWEDTFPLRGRHRRL